MDVSIIGGGIAGLVLALTLHKHSVKCTIYELRETADIANPGAVELAPNGLRVLDHLGLHDQLLSIGWPITSMQFRNEQDELIASVDVGGVETYGYDTLRVVRKRLHDILLTAVKTASIPIISGKKFSHVVSSTSSSITFTLTDATQITSSFLIGADGIHSTVRKTFNPSIQPHYKGSLAVAAKVQRNPLLTLPQTPTLSSRLHSVCITTGADAAFLAIVQSFDGQEVAYAVDRLYPDRSREEWEALLASKEKQYELFMSDYDRWPETIQLMMRAVTPDDMYRSWPYYAIPDLRTWTSDDAKTILIGDAAHAVPPSAGQGANMAIEDAWSLGVVLGGCQTNQIDVSSVSLKDRIADWQEQRRDRVQRVRMLTAKMGNARLPKEMRDQLPEEERFEAGQHNDLQWLYGYEFQGR